MNRLISALYFSAHKHRHQRRKDAEALPYINHPIGLLNVLAVEGGVTDELPLLAAVLHDTIEDTDATPEELTLHFGAEVCATVLEVSDDKSLPKEVRKQLQIEHAPQLSHAAKLVKLADLICNVRDMGVRAPLGWSVERQRAYFDWAQAVAAGLRGTHPLLERALDDACLMRP